MNTINQRREERRRHAEEEGKALAQARLVVMGTPIPDSDAKKERNSNARHMKLTTVNHSDRAIVDVAFAIRPQEPNSASFIQAFTYSLLVLEAGATQTFSWCDHYSSNDETQWRMEWTDADGVHWYRDNRSGADPTRGQRVESAYIAGGSRPAASNPTGVHS
jgi:hypothetical protein